MIKIGDFSKLAHVSVKTLHHYGRLGLLKPAHIDRFNGYRYYTIQQLSRLNRILALKDLGFSLEQVTRLLDTDLSTAEMRGMLKMKQIELAERLEAEHARLARVEMRLQQLEQEGKHPQNEVVLKDVPAQTVLVAVARTNSVEDVPTKRRELQVLIQDRLERARLRPYSPWFALVDELTYQEDNLKIEMAVGIKPSANTKPGDWAGSPVKLRQFPAVANMASLIHQGEYNTLVQAYTTLFAWTQASGYRFEGAYREIYLPEKGISALLPNNEGVCLTEIQCPVKKAGIPLSIISPHSKQEDIPMKPNFVSKEAFKVVGISYVGKNENQEIPKLWEEFNPRMKELKNAEYCCYGACFGDVEGAADDEFEYIACVAVESTPDIPEGMVMREIPAHKYAVFTHHGSLETLHDTYEYIYNTWLPQSGYELDGKFDMEMYDDDFNMDDWDNSKFYIYVAIK
jgi:predicted transcriptional regulator YdeE/DNA-binding transcriptional MerR regulator